MPFFLFCYRCCIRCWVVSFIVSDRAAAAVIHLHAEEFVAGQRVCLFWPHDGTSALGSRCGPACVFFWPHDGVSAAVIQCTRSRCRIRNSLHAEEFVAGQRVCLFWPHDGTSALGSRCGPACVCFFWPHDGVSAAVIHCTRSRCSIRNSQHADEGFAPKSCNLGRWLER